MIQLRINMDEVTTEQLIHREIDKRRSAVYAVIRTGATRILVERHQKEWTEIHHRLSVFAGLFSPLSPLPSEDDIKAMERQHENKDSRVEDQS